MSLHRISLWLLYLATVLLVIGLVVHGGSYLGMSMLERPHHPLHATWKPSGAIGHGLGIIGSAMMLLLLFYSARKRWRSMQNAGNIRYWLNYHIWLGVTGPVLVIFHTTFKIGGIVAVSFWSMVGVALSGALGRYLYMQIPHSLSGQELTARDLDEMDRGLQVQLKEKHKLADSTLQMIQQAGGEEHTTQRKGWGSLWYWFLRDITLRARLSRIREELRRTSGLHGAEMHEVMSVVRRKVKLRRRMAFLSTARDLLHHWHIIHRPFAIVMLVIMTVHVIVTLLFGYHWIF